MEKLFYVHLPCAVEAGWPYKVPQSTLDSIHHISALAFHDTEPSRLPIWTQLLTDLHNRKVIHPFQIIFIYTSGSLCYLSGVSHVHAADLLYIN